MDKCCICGKQLNKELSLERGMGDVCASKFKKFTQSKKSENPLMASYSFQYVEIAKNKVGIVIDGDDGRSVTNAIEDVAKELGVKHIVYRDTMGSWDYWGEDIGFKTLSLKGKPTENMDIAIEVAKSRCFNLIGGLFE